MNIPLSSFNEIKNRIYESKKNLKKRIRFLKNPQKPKEPDLVDQVIQSELKYK